MLLIDQLAEARIAEAMRDGTFENLPGAGKRVVLDDDRHIPESLRVAYRILKNSGFLPRELALRGEINETRMLLACGDDSERAQLSKRLNYLLTKLGQERRRDVSLAIEQAYLRKLAQRFEQDR